MNKIIKYLLFSIFSFLLFTLIFSNNAKASDLVYKESPNKLTANKWVNVKERKMYEISLPSNCYVKVEFEGSKADNRRIGMNVYHKTKKNTYEYLGSWAKTTYNFSASKGKYYFRPSFDCKVRYNIFKLTDNKTNYCFAKAATLKSGKKETFTLGDKNSFSRWYKISISKTSTLTVYREATCFDYGGHSLLIDLYNADGEDIAYGSMNQYAENTSTKTLERGTYYLHIIDYSGNNMVHPCDYNERVVTIKWK